LLDNRPEIWYDNCKKRNPKRNEELARMKRKTTKEILAESFRELAEIYGSTLPQPLLQLVMKEK